MEILKFRSLKEIVEKRRIQTTDLEKIFAKPVSDKGHVSQIFKVLSKLNNRKINHYIYISMYLYIYVSMYLSIIDHKRRVTSLVVMGLSGSAKNCNLGSAICDPATRRGEIVYRG